MKWQMPAPGATAAALAAFLACVLLVGLATIGLMAVLQLVEPLEEQASTGELDAIEPAARPAAWIRSLLKPVS
jgi:hypothetical protein